MKALSYRRTPCAWRWTMHVLLHRAGSCVGALVVALLLSQIRLAADTSVQPPLHTFTNPTGRTIQGNLLRFADPDVYLVNAKGDTIHVKISALVNADQVYVRQWAKTQAAADTLATSALRISATPNRLVGDERQGGPQSFAVSLKNLGNNPLKGLKASYILFRLPGTGGKVIHFPLPRLTGDSPIKSITPNGALTFNTITLTNRNAPLAIWVRIYGSDGSIVQEYCSQPDIMQFEKWDTGDLITTPNASGGESDGLSSSALASGK